MTTSTTSSTTTTTTTALTTTCGLVRHITTARPRWDERPVAFSLPEYVEYSCYCYDYGDDYQYYYD
eukprot:3906572-Pyramimonas_sp.AAC.1